MTGHKPLNKSSSFLTKNSSMQQQFTNPPQPTTLVPKKWTSFQYPTSPQPILDHEILHFSHPQHPIVEMNLPDSFTCAGCKEYGAGKRFSCRQCSFELHDFCGFAPPVLSGHPLHYHHQLVLYSKPVKGGAQLKCDVCSKPAKGFTFKCAACSFQMHPCCAMLSTEIDIAAHPHKLKLIPSMSIDSGNFICGECKRRRSGRVYHCTVCDYHLHAVCAKSMINGLHANGIKDKEKPSMIGTAARLASIVVIEFIGGLIDGLGQGLGEALVQNVARGKCLSSKRKIH